MSAAATAAGYLYASGRLRGRSKDAEEPVKRESAPPRRPRVRVAVLPEREPVAEPKPAPRVRPAPRIEYRVRRWRPEAGRPDAE